MNPVYAAPINLSEEYSFGGIDTLGQGISYLVTPALALAGVIFMFWFLWAAFDLIISGGDKEKVAAARNKINHTLIGLSLLIVLFLILQYLPEALGLKGFKIIGP